MKNLILFLCGFVLFISFSQAQVSTTGTKAFEAIMVGNAEALSPLLDRQTDYIQDINFVVNSPQQIVLQLKKFLEKHPCASLKVVNEGASKDFSFARADYIASSGQKFWLTLFIKADKLSRIKIARQ